MPRIQKSSALAVVLAAVALMSLAALSLGQDPKETGKPFRSWALVIGISKYAGLPGGQQLKFADQDAAAFADTITKCGTPAENVRLLMGQQATAAAIRSALGNWLARAASESDTLYIYFSGHGFYEKEFGESYLLPYDANPSDPYASALPLRELQYAIASRIRAGRV
jgi:uncharacterized caspase-like protein